MAASPNSVRSKRAIDRRSRHLNKRTPTTMSTAASMESGTSIRTLAKGRKRSTTRAAASGPTWVRPAGVDERAGPRWAGVDRERADEAGQDAAGADGEEVTPGVDVVLTLRGEGPRRRGGLGDDHEGDHPGQRDELAHRRPRQSREPEVGRAGVDGAEHGDAVGLQVEDVHEDDRADQGDQGAGDAPVDAGRDDHDGHHAEAHEQRPDAGPRRGGRIDVEEAVLVRAARRRQAEEVGQLVDDDDHGDAGEKAGGDRRGEELGDPAQPQDAHEHHDQPDHHGQDAHQLDVVRRAQGGEADDPRREQRRDRRVGADRHLRVGAEEGEEHGAGDEGVEAGDRGHPGEPRGRQLLGQRDGEQRQSGHEVGTRPGALVPAQ